jgi:hypothetical protein
VIARDKDAEMFEAFRAARRDHKVRLPGPQGEPSEPSESPAAEPEAKPEPERGVEPSVPPRRESAPSWHNGVVESDEVHVFPLGVRANVVFALSYNALIVVVLALALVVLMTGFLGYTLGVRTATPAVATPGEIEDTGELEAVPPKKDVEPPPKKDETGKGVIPPSRQVAYRIRVLTVPNTREREQAVMEDKRILEQHGLSEVIVQKSRTGAHLLLYAGAFTADERDKAEAVVQQIKRIRVSGRYEFRDARVVPVRN